MTELETIVFTKGFIDKMAQGINPINGEKLPATDLLNNVRVSRCLYLVSDYLRQIIENGGLHVDPPRRSCVPFALSPEAVVQFPFSDTPLTLQDLVNRLNSLTGRSDMASLHPQSLTAALAEKGLLEVSVQAKTQTVSVTQEGLAAGLLMQEKRLAGSVCQVLTLDLQAQALVLDLLPRIIEIDRAV